MNVALFAIAAVVLAHAAPPAAAAERAAYEPQPYVLPRTGERELVCGHAEMDAYDRREQLSAEAAARGVPLAELLAADRATCTHHACDDPTVRDATDTRKKSVRIAVTVVNNVIDEDGVHEALKRAEEVFAPANISFAVGERVYFRTYAEARCLPASGYREALNDVKDAFAVAPYAQLNIFIGCMDEGGGLAGVGSFPWRGLARKPHGGMWVNVNAMTTPLGTWSHEIGHCLGLWHTFHGVSEVDDCDDQELCPRNSCCEPVHPRNRTTESPFNRVGDLAADTDSTPRSFFCTTPNTTDCAGARFDQHGDINWDNLMSYSKRDPHTEKPVWCRREFTPQQVRRAHCYLASSLLNTWLVDDDANANANANANAAAADGQARII